METLFVTAVGSALQGLLHPGSDLDTAGVFACSLPTLYSPFKDLPQTNRAAEHTLYELQHFVRLATNGNWTALEALYSTLPVQESERGLVLRTNASKLLNSRAMLQAAAGHGRGVEHLDNVSANRFLLHRWRILRAGLHYAKHGVIDFDCRNVPGLLDLKLDPTDALMDKFRTECMDMRTALALRIAAEEYRPAVPDRHWLEDFCRVTYLGE